MHPLFHSLGYLASFNLVAFFYFLHHSITQYVICPCEIMGVWVWGWFAHFPCVWEAFLFHLRSAPVDGYINVHRLLDEPALLDGVSVTELPGLGLAHRLVGKSALLLPLGEALLALVHAAALVRHPAALVNHSTISTIN